MEINNRYPIQEPSSLNEYSLNQVRTIARVIKSMSRVISCMNTLDQEKDSLGPIEYVYPKDPNKKITKAFFRISLIGHSGTFSRINDQLPWHTSGFITAREEETYQMGLTRNFFTRELGLVFDKAILEKRHHMPLPEYHLFYFHKKLGDVKIQYIFETRTDASDLKADFPKSFHEVRIFDSSVTEK